MRMKKVKIGAFIDIEEYLEFDDSATEEDIEKEVGHFVSERLDVWWREE